MSVLATARSRRNSRPLFCHGKQIIIVGSYGNYIKCFYRTLLLYRQVQAEELERFISVEKRYQRGVAEVGIQNSPQAREREQTRWSRVGMHRERWYTEVRLLIFWAHLDQMQRNANPEMVVLFTKNQTKGKSTPVTETDFHFKTTFLRAARRVFATKSFGCF